MTEAVGSANNHSHHTRPVLDQSRVTFTAELLTNTLDRETQGLNAISDERYDNKTGQHLSLALTTTANELVCLMN